MGFHILVFVTLVIFVKWGVLGDAVLPIFKLSLGGLVVADKITVLVVSPNLKPEVKEIDNTLNELESIIGEDLVYSNPFIDAIGIVSKYEYEKSSLPVSRVLINEKGETVEILKGTIVIVGLDEEDNFISLSQELREKYYGKFLDYKVQLPYYRDI